MESKLKGAGTLLVAGLAGLALTAGAQTTKSSQANAAKHSRVQKHGQKPTGHSAHRKVSAGEAASLEREEAGQSSEDIREDNRGRLTSARLQRKPGQVSNTMYHGPSKAAAAKQKNVNQQAQPAQLK